MLLLLSENPWRQKKVSQYAWNGKNYSNIKVGSNPSTVKEKLGDGCAVKIRILQQHHNSSNVASVFKSQTILLGFLQGNERHIIKKPQTYMGICYVPITGNIIVHKVNIVLTLIWGRWISRCQVKIELSSTRQVCILKLKVRNNQCLQIVTHVTGTVASTRGIKIKKQSCL